MSAKQLLRLTLIFAVLLVLWGAAALASRREGVPHGEAFRLPSVARAGVDTVLLERARDTTVLARMDTSAWTVNGHPAAPQALEALFAALADTTARSELVAERRASHAALGVDSAGGTHVRVRGGGRTLADFVVGHRAPDFSGGYVRLADKEPTYLVRGQLAEVMNRMPNDWRDRRIASVQPDSVAAIEVSRGARRYTLRHTAGGWKLIPGGAADSAGAVELVAAYRTLEASDFAPQAQADSARFDRPDRRTRLLRKDGTPILTLLFDSTAAGYWVRPDTGTTVYRIETWTADRLAPADSTLRASAGR